MTTYDKDQLTIDALSGYNDDTYERLGSDVSVTELLRPPRVNHLMDMYRDKLKVDDLKNIIPSMIGTGFHDQIQKRLRDNPKWLTERRLTATVDDVRIAGRFDALYNREVLYDIKVTKVYKYMKGDYIEWEQQLNIYDWMLSKDGIKVKSLKIYMVLLDWNVGKSWKAGYPKSNIIILDLPKWTFTQQESFLKKCVSLWKNSKSNDQAALPLCTQEERWAGSSTWKLYRKSNHNRATKTFPTEERAKEYLKVCKTNDKDKWEDAVITEVKENPWKRCDWCAVQQFCDQYKNKLEP